MYVCVIMYICHAFKFCLITYILTYISAHISIFVQVYKFVKKALPEEEDIKLEFASKLMVLGISLPKYI